MTQQLDSQQWPSILFEGESLPQSLSGIHILIDRDFTELTGDWIWRLPHCKNVWKQGAAAWCIASVTEITDHLLDHRDEIILEITTRLGRFGFDGLATYEEWLTGLARIRTLAAASNGGCRWIAGEPMEDPKAFYQRLLNRIDAASS